MTTTVPTTIDVVVTSIRNGDQDDYLGVLAGAIASRILAMSGRDTCDQPYVVQRTVVRCMLPVEHLRPSLRTPHIAFDDHGRRVSWTEPSSTT